MSLSAPASDSIQLERYVDWFGWAITTLGRDVDAAHAAAEAAFSAGSSDGGADEAQLAAQKAGSEPKSTDVETMALAEWSWWARSTFRLSPAASLVVAKQALASVGSTHDLDGTISEITAVVRSQPPSPTARTSSRRSWLIVAGIVGALFVVLSAATFGVMQATRTGVEPAPNIYANATIQVTTQPSGEATVVLSGFPKYSPIWIFIDDKQQTSLSADEAGYAQTTVRIPRGGHMVRACSDSFAEHCPATAFVTAA